MLLRALERLQVQSGRAMVRPQKFLDLIRGTDKRPRGSLPTTMAEKSFTVLYFAGE